MDAEAASVLLEEHCRGFANIYHSSLTIRPNDLDPCTKLQPMTGTRPIQAFFGRPKEGSTNALNVH